MNMLLNSTAMDLPLAFVWTRVGIEAGQSLESIFRRKEEERVSNKGLFFWGIGNAIGPSVAQLVTHVPKPTVIFSPIKSSANKMDVTPKDVVAWTRAEDLYGRKFELPQHALITSRLNPTYPKKAHYALVCSSATPLTMMQRQGTLNVGELENLLTGRQVGASQVTAVVQRRSCKNTPSRTYNVVLHAELQAPFFLRLRSPISLAPNKNKPYWESIVNEVWAARIGSSALPEQVIQEILNDTDATYATGDSDEPLFFTKPDRNSKLDILKRIGS